MNSIRQFLPFVSSAAFACCAAGQVCSTGADGPLVVGGNTTLTLPADGVFNFTTITVGPGATLRFTENAANTPVYLLTTGAVQIDGAIQVSAFGVTGGAGGGDGGLNGVGFQAGTDGGGPSPGRGGPAAERPGNAGGGGGMATAGLRAIRWTGASPADGGPAVLFPEPLTGGSGGGGGSGWVLFGVNLNGGVGGGGGGGVHICSSGTITIGGSVLANGGGGGTAFANAFGHGGPGGGGSGGVVDLIADRIVIEQDATIQCNGQPGGGISTMPVWDPNFPSGATGGQGYIRLRARSISNDGTLQGVVIGADLCPGDLDNDGDVDIGDLSLLLSHYGEAAGAKFDEGDTDCDGDIDLADLATVLSRFGAHCD